MFGVKRYLFSGLSLLPLSIIASSALCGQLSISTEVQGNINTLQQTKSCPQCDLSGADLNRMDLSGANLEGANLSRAKLNLANLTGANLRKADLRDVVFGGADLADADLRGADLRGTSFAGAYMSGVLLDGELITTTPYTQEQMSNVEETMYVEDTVKPKIVPTTEEMNIGARRDFEEIPPTLPDEQVELEKDNLDAEGMVREDVISERSDFTDALVPQESAAAPESKTAPSIQQVRMAAMDEKDVNVSDMVDRDVQQAEILSEEEIKEGEQPRVAPLPQIQDSMESEETNVAANPTNQTLEGTNKIEDTETTIIADQEPVVMKEQASAENTEYVTKAPAIESSSTVEKSIPEQTNSDTGNGVDPSMIIEKKPETEKKVEEINSASGTEQALLSIDSEVLRNVEILLDTNQCYGCNLEGADLSGKDLDESDLEGANLKMANLSGAELNKANLKGANLTGADLRKADLDGADLYKADLTDADLTEASLDETLIDDAVLTGVKGYQQGTLLMME